jgi:hypothetical protein
MEINESYLTKSLDSIVSSLEQSCYDLHQNIDTSLYEIWEK